MSGVTHMPGIPPLLVLTVGERGAQKNLHNNNMLYKHPTVKHEQHNHSQKTATDRLCRFLLFLTKTSVQPSIKEEAELPLVEQNPMTTGSLTNSPSWLLLKDSSNSIMGKGSPLIQLNVCCCVCSKLASYHSAQCNHLTVWPLL